jgi:hypothetical protein
MPLYLFGRETQMSLLTKIAGAIVGILIVVVGVGFILPSQIHVERDIVIDATPAELFPLVSDFNAWDAWSPWALRDPNATMEVPGSGLGQTMTWSSENPEVGQGSQTITEITAPHYVKTHLDFGEQGLADAAFNLVPEDGQTRVIWSLDTNMREGVPRLKQPISTYFGFFMDSMIGNEISDHRLKGTEKTETHPRV